MKELGYYEAIYLIINILSTYTIYLLYGIFFKNECLIVKTNTLKIAYLFYYVIISCVYFWENSSFLNLICNLIMFFCMTFLYKSNLQRKLLATFFSYAIMLLIESILVLLTSSMMQSDIESEKVMALISSKIITFMIVRAFNHFKALKEDIFVPKIQWFSVIIFPIGSICLFYTAVLSCSKNFIFITSIIILFFNITIIFVYDRLKNGYINEFRNKLKYQEKKLEAELNFREKMAYRQQLYIT